MVLLDLVRGVMRTRERIDDAGLAARIAAAAMVSADTE